MKTEEELALEFFNTVRGKYIISKALFLAIEHLESQKENNTNANLIFEMKYLMDNLFPLCKKLYETNAPGQAKQQRLSASPHFEK
ncbi:MAG: hypothetical protein ACOY90_04115 [Candidatus Zhuqueibacterota bacterium]